MQHDLGRAVGFLNSIGLNCAPRAGVSGFMPGVLIERGELFFDFQAKASDLLHEAGHLAIVPARYRSWFSGNVSVGVKAMLEAVDFADPDAPEARAAVNCSDPEATAWAWAAGEAIGLAPQVVVADADYGGEGGAIRAMLQARAYAGIHGLAHAGFCAVRQGRLAAARSLPAYPTLARWLQN